ncbi:MAG TPA: DUF2927 domain-containing protein [Paracoccus sp. (in: a-proteobacteria)]|nr:DUF2927 domain-containing protein [Paracoccus sp. (in: a-proteobacteria)]
MLVLLAACAPQTAPKAPPLAGAAPQPRPAVVLTPTRPLGRREPPPPGPASQMMTQYLASVEQALVGQGFLRTDPGTGLPRPTPAELAETFVQVALRDEYRMQDGVLVPQAHAAPLRRWSGPVRMSVEFGPSVARPARAQDRAWLRDFAARLGRVSGHPVRLTDGPGNFVVLIVDEEERRAIGPRLAQLIPGIPAADVRAIENLAPQNYCTVFAYSPAGRPAYSNAVAVIRAELPPLLRLSCIHEELAQGMGLANDSPQARPSIFNDDEEFAFLTWQDELLLKMLYDPRLSPGMTEDQARPIALAVAAELLR